MSKNGYYTAFGEFKTINNNVVEHMTEQDQPTDCPEGYVCLLESEYNHLVDTSNHNNTPTPMDMSTSMDMSTPIPTGTSMDMSSPTPSSTSNDEKIDCQRCNDVTYAKSHKKCEKYNVDNDTSVCNPGTFD